MYLPELADFVGLVEMDGWGWLLVIIHQAAHVLTMELTKALLRKYFPATRKPVEIQPLTSIATESDGAAESNLN